MRKKWIKWLMLPLLSFFLTACGVIQTPEEIETPTDDEVETSTGPAIIEGGSYDTAEEVAAYLEE